MNKRLFSLRAMAILKISVRELLRSQILWSAVFLQFFLSLLFVPLAEVGFDESERIYDTLSYFIMTLEALLVACLIGSFLCSRDFSKSGLAEVFCRGDFSPGALLVFRLMAFSGGLLVFVTCLGIVHALGVALFAPTRLDFKVISLMIAGTSSLAVVSLLLSCFLSLLVRPAFAALATIFLMAIGDLAESLSGISTLSSQDEKYMGGVSIALDALVSLWRPQDVILDQTGGVWTMPSLPGAMATLGWSLGAGILFVCLIGLLSRRSVKDRLG